MKKARGNAVITGATASPADKYIVISWGFLPAAGQRIGLWISVRSTQVKGLVSHD